MIRTLPFYHFLTQNILSEIEPETQQNYVFEQILNHFHNFEPIPPLISGLNSKFHYSTLRALNGSLVSQNFVLKSYLYQKLLRKRLWAGSARPPPPVGSSPWEGLKFPFQRSTACSGTICFSKVIGRERKGCPEPPLPLLCKLLCQVYHLMC